MAAMMSACCSLRDQHILLRCSSPPSCRSSRTRWWPGGPLPPPGMVSFPVGGHRVDLRSTKCTVRRRRIRTLRSSPAANSRSRPRARARLCSGRRLPARRLGRADPYRGRRRPRLPRVAGRCVGRRLRRQHRCVRTRRRGRDPFWLPTAPRRICRWGEKKMGGRPDWAAPPTPGIFWGAFLF